MSQKVTPKAATQILEALCSHRKDDNIKNEDASGPDVRASGADVSPVNQQADARQDEQSRARHAGEQPSTRNTGDEQTVTFKIQMYG